MRVLATLFLFSTATAFVVPSTPTLSTKHSSAVEESATDEAPPAPKYPTLNGWTASDDGEYNT